MHVTSLKTTYHRHAGVMSQISSPMGNNAIVLQLEFIAGRRHKFRDSSTLRRDHLPDNRKPPICPTHYQ